MGGKSTGNNYGKIIRKKEQGKKYGEKSTGKKSTGGKVRGKVTWLPVMSLPVKHAQWPDPLDPPHGSSANTNWTVPIYYCRGTIWHTARWKALVVVPYDTLPGERRWSWYHMTHCQVRGTGHGTVWHILTHDHVGNEYKISTNSETIKVFNNSYAFVSIGNARLYTSMWLITLLG